MKDEEIDSCLFPRSLVQNDLRTWMPLINFHIINCYTIRTVWRNSYFTFLLFLFNAAPESIINHFHFINHQNLKSFFFSFFVLLSLSFEHNIIFMINTVSLSLSLWLYIICKLQSSQILIIVNIRWKIKKDKFLIKYTNYFGSISLF